MQGIVGKQIPFIQYSVKMGRELLRRGLTVMPGVYKIWRSSNVQDPWLGVGWKWLWAMQIPKKVVLFRWLLVHNGIPMKSWMWGHYHDLNVIVVVFPVN